MPRTKIVYDHSIKYVKYHEMFAKLKIEITERNYRVKLIFFFRYFEAKFSTFFDLNKNKIFQLNSVFYFVFFFVIKTESYYYWNKISWTQHPTNKLVRLSHPLIFIWRAWKPSIESVIRPNPSIRQKIHDLIGASSCIFILPRSRFRFYYAKYPLMVHCSYSTSLCTKLI